MPWSRRVGPRTALGIAGTAIRAGAPAPSLCPFARTCSPCTLAAWSMMEVMTSGWPCIRPRIVASGRCSAGSVQGCLEQKTAGRAGGGSSSGGGGELQRALRRLPQALRSGRSALDRAASHRGPGGAPDEALGSRQGRARPSLLVCGNQQAAASCGIADCRPICPPGPSAAWDAGTPATAQQEMRPTPSSHIRPPHWCTLHIVYRAAGGSRKLRLSVENSAENVPPPRQGDWENTRAEAEAQAGEIKGKARNGEDRALGLLDF